MTPDTIYPLQSAHYTFRLQKSILVLILCLTFIFGTIQSGRAASYYWVGGSGDWSDINHWVTTSGGNINYTLVPTANDDVYFDQNSFTGPGQTVTLNAGNYVCKNMMWIGVQYQPTLYGSANYNFRVYGALKLSPDMNFDVHGVFHFESTSTGNSIDMAGHAFLNSVWFEGIDGGWILWNDLLVGNFTIYLANGSLNTQNHDIYCNTFYSMYTTSRELFLGSSSCFLQGGWSVNATNLVFDAGISSIYLSSPLALLYNTGGFLSYYDVYFTDTNGLVTLESSLNNPIAFNKVNFLCNAKIFGDLIFNRLELMNKDYLLRENDTLTILQDLVTTGNCQSSVLIRSTHDSIYSFIRKSNGTLTADYVILQDIAAIGGAGFFASNSIDLGNNPGWNISSPAPLDLYWVGGSGNWDDPQHWSLSTGGTGGACVPNPLDNVYFDQNSFPSSGQSVTLNGCNSFCHNMSWAAVTNHPLFRGPAVNTLNIFGSLTFSSDLDYQFTGQTFFSARDTGNTITMAGQIWKSNVIFKGDMGGWKLMDDFDAGGNNIFLVKGYLNTDGNTVQCLTFISAYQHYRGLQLGSSRVNISGYLASAWNFCNYHLSFDAGTSEINFTGNYGGMVNTAGDTMRFYHVNFLNPNGMASLNSSSIISKFQKVNFVNNGSLRGTNVFDTINLSNSFYILYINDTQIVRQQLNIAGSCSGFTYIFSSTDGQPAFIKLESGTQNYSYLILQDIHLNGSSITHALSSVDMGNNNGWIFSSLTARDLYWVGGSGNWNDPSHWALNSGGSGGECIPTPLDNVTFDALSFSVPGDYVRIDAFYSFCHTMQWHNLQNTSTFIGSGSCKLMVYGSLILDTNIQYQFDGGIYFKASDSGNILDPAGRLFRGNIFFYGENGEWSFVNDFQSLKSIVLYRGHLKSQNNAWNCLSFSTNSGYPRSLDLGSSQISLFGGDYTTFLASNTNFHLDAGTSTLLFPSPNGGMYLFGAGSLAFHDVFFTNITGCSVLLNTIGNCSFHHVSFRSNGQIRGDNSYDTLTFYPAMTYVLESGKTQNIEERLNMVGNGCFPITLKSSVAGLPSFMHKANGIVSAAYVEMRDQHANGGAIFYTGNYSVDISGNNGWIFSSGPGYVFGLPDTAYICPGDTMNINTSNFIGGIQFTWQDGSISSNFAATDEGTYTVEVLYADECYLTDTLRLLYLPVPNVEMQADTSICPGTSITLTALGVPGVDYLWNTGDTTSVITTTPSSAFQYIVTVTNSCGTASDDVMVYTYAPAFVDAGHDTSVCPGSYLELEGHAQTGSSYLWNTGDTTATIAINPDSSALYVVQVSDQHFCSVVTDTVAVTVYPLPFVNAGPDLILCNGSMHQIIAQGLPGSSYLWNTGSQNQSIYIQGNTDTQYIVQASDIHQCGIAVDTVKVSILNAPQVWAGSDIEICAGDQVTLYPTVIGANSILWSNGDTNSNITISPAATGDIILTAFNDCGSSSDALHITVRALPIINLEITNESCERGDGAIVATGGNNYLWSNGNSGPIIYDLSAGTYSVTVSDSYCSNVATANITNKPGPQAAFVVNSDFLYVGQDNFIFRDASTGATEWFWDFGDQHTASSVTEVSHRYQETGTYPVRLIVMDERACTDTSTLDVTYEYPDLFYMPNAFSPNGDGKNETIGPVWRLPEQLHSYKMYIYNRWGELIFSTSDPNANWDGHIDNGKDNSQDGVYSWIISGEIGEGLAQQWTGQITLLH